MINNIKDKIKIKSKRNSAIELLRILAMIMIIFSHYSVHGVIDSNTLPFSFNKIILQASVLGNLGVAIFVIITGYYSSKNDFSIKKLIYLYMQVWFYSVIIYLLLVLFGVSSFSFKGLLKCLFPLIFKEYWFMSAYFLLSIFIPFINKLLNSINKKQFILFLSLLTIIWFFIPTFAREFPYGGEFILFVTFYSYGAYVRMYNNDFKRSNKFYFICTLSLALILLSSIILIDYLGIGNGLAFMYNNSLFILLLALFIFINFEKIKPFNNDIINKISACTLGIYLIHDNNYIRPLLWKSIVKNNLIINSPWLFMDIIKWAMLVFIICTLIELIRINFIHKPLIKIIDAHLDRIIAKIKDIYEKITGYIFNKE